MVLNCACLNHSLNTLQQVHLFRDLDSLTAYFTEQRGQKVEQ